MHGQTEKGIRSIRKQIPAKYVTLLPAQGIQKGDRQEKKVQLQVLFILTRKLFARNFLILPHML